MLALLVVSCKLDNYESPNATFYGSIIDIDTNTPDPTRTHTGIYD